MASHPRNDFLCRSPAISAPVHGSCVSHPARKPGSPSCPPPPAQLTLTPSSRSPPADSAQPARPWHTARSLRGPPQKLKPAAADLTPHMQRRAARSEKVPTCPAPMPTPQGSACRCEDRARTPGCSTPQQPLPSPAQSPVLTSEMSKHPHEVCLFRHGPKKENPRVEQPAPERPLNPS